MLIQSNYLSSQDIRAANNVSEITIKKDTVRGRVIEHSVIKFKKDSVFVYEQDKKIAKLDSIINSKKTKK